MEDKKTSVFALLRILEDNSDESHILKQPELLRLLESIYDVKLDRRTLYRNIEMLQDFGYDISTYTENGTGYYLRERAFEPSQINLLCNAIHSSRFIPSRSSKELIDKLLSTQSRYFRGDFKSAVFIDNRDKKENKEFFLNVDLIGEAIKIRKPISFNYTQYNLKKELINKREESYIISPHYMVYRNDKTFLIGKSDHYNGLIHFRVDKMKNIKIKNDRQYMKLGKREDPYEYAKTKIYMYSGDEYRVVMRCDNLILDDIIDVFGKDIRLEKHDESSFDAYVKSSKQGIVYFALQYMNYLQVLDPVEIRDEIKQSIDCAQQKYSK